MTLKSWLANRWIVEHETSAEEAPGSRRCGPPWIKISGRSFRLSTYQKVGRDTQRFS